MRKCLILLSFLLSMTIPTYALEIEAPQVTGNAAKVMPENTESFAEAVGELLRSVLMKLRPDLQDAVRISLSLTASVMLISLLESCTGGAKRSTELAGAIAVASVLLGSTNSMLGLASRTVKEISEYGKLLFPVMTAAMAAQGGVTSSAALYAGTAAFDMILTSLIAELFLPLVYLFLVMAAAHSALGEDLLKRFRDMLKGFVSWCLKMLLTIYTTYMSITGVVSGTTDAATLKAARVTISSFVPVVGGILSDASEAVLVSAGVMKNAAGIYGIVALLAIFLEPFMRIGIHYLILKATAAVCSVFGARGMNELIDSFAAAMGLLLGMTGAVCLMMLISVVCFLKGVG